MNGKYTIHRKNDDYRIKSNNIIFNELGVWIYDDLESGDESSRLFIPWHNVLQIFETKEL